MSKKQTEYERKLHDTEAAGDAAGVALEGAMARVQRETDKALTKMLAELKSMGPEGKQAAEEIRKHLVGAGQLAERSMADVVAEIAKINPAAAQAGRDLVAAGEKGESSFKKFGQSAVAEVSALAASYFGVQEVLGSINAYLEKQRDLIREAGEAQRELARSQQDASKNLSALTPEQSTALLGKAGDIAQAAGFGDLKAITDALGSVASMGVSDPAKIENAVTQTARLERLTPKGLRALRPARQTSSKKRDSTTFVKR